MTQKERIIRELKNKIIGAGISGKSDRDILIQLQIDVIEIYDLIDKYLVDNIK